jgi:UPF0042 nucleotide-binding protein
MEQRKQKLVVVTGLSGSGKSIALDALEDVGFYCIDNLPVSLLETFSGELTRDPNRLYRRAAVGIDVRNQANDLRLVPPLVTRLRNLGVHCEILFLDAQTDVLMQRFSETRRRHPLTDDDRSLENAIRLERDLLEPLLSNADLRIDTTRTTLHELRATIRNRVAERPADQLSILIESFGFKHGVPRNADFVFDTRCLPNPHWRPELRPYTGRDAAVAEFLAADAGVNRMFEQIAGFLDEWIPCFASSGRSYLTVALGCTGGQHRSVYLAERIAAYLNAHGHTALTGHRELP